MERREKTERKVFSYMKKHGMLRPGDRVVLGVSGGADSVCLFLLLLEYGKRVPIQPAVVHVNHGIRREAVEDARFVEELCRGKGVPFYLEEADVQGLARREGYSEEDAGRRVRYEAFFRVAGELGGARIAVAHNSNDNAETMLFHLFRGSGIQGLSGIAPVRGNLIRPILCLERREVEGYLESVHARWCRDMTNEGDDYRRNRIRHHILPYAEEAVACGAVSHMAGTAALLRETEEYLELQTREAMENCVETVREEAETAGKGAKTAEASGEGTEASEAEWEDTGIAGRCGETLPGTAVRIDVSRFCQHHTVIRKRVIFRLLKLLSPTGKDISAVHVLDTLELFERAGNRTICLPFGIKVWRQYGQVLLKRQESQGTPELAKYPIAIPPYAEIFSAPAVYDLGDWGKIEVMGLFIKKGQEVPLKRYTKWFDCDKIKEWVEIRSRRQGDYLTIADRAGNTVHKSLKDYMITEKIPRQIRDEILVVASGSHVLWLAGWRISEAFKIDENTERILQIRLLGTKFNERGETEEENGGEH